MAFDRLIQETISGQQRTPAYTAARLALHGLSWPYSLMMDIRNALYDHGLRRTTRTPVPVISVGNITTGGTGKTPLVATVVGMLQEDGLRPGIVSRGYRADASGRNDEQRVLEYLCPDVPHAQNPDRIAAATEIIATHHVNCIVLDDAFQHRRIARDLNLVLIDAMNPFGYGHVLPRGLLREPVKGLQRADLVIVTRDDQVSSDVLESIRQKIIRASGIAAERIISVAFQATQLLDAKKNRCPLSELHHRRVMVMTAIGNPNGFIRTCEQAGTLVVGRRIFADHHHYSESDLLSVQQESQRLNADFVVTTLKDLVKIPAAQEPAVPIRAIETATHFGSHAAEKQMQTALRQAVLQSP